MGGAPDREVLRDLVRFMKSRDYLETSRFPSLRRPLWMLPLEPHVMLKYFGGRTSPFTPSAIPHLYGRVWRKLHGTTDILYRLFYLNRPVRTDDLHGVMDDRMYESLLQAGIAHEAGNDVVSDCRLVPWGGSIFLSDPDQGDRRTTEHYVYVGSDSVLLADFVKREMLNRDYSRGLDLCAGTAFQGHSIKPYCSGVLAAEYNPRAVDFARTTLYANDMTEDFEIVQSDLWERVTGSFDLIVSNPPYYPVDESKRDATILDVFGGSDHGMEKPLIIFDGLGQYLDRGGEAAILAASPVIDGENVLVERLQAPAARHGLETVLVPWKYTNIKLEPEYQVKHGIDYLIHYIVFARRTGAGDVAIAPYPVLVRMFEKLQIHAQKWLPSWPEG